MNLNFAKLNKEYIIERINGIEFSYYGLKSGESICVKGKRKKMLLIRVGFSNFAINDILANLIEVRERSGGK